MEKFSKNLLWDSDLKIDKWSYHLYACSNSNIPVPYMLVVDDTAFQLNEYTLRPYPGNRLNRIREIFNKRLSRARRVVENAFGIMASKWRNLIGNLLMHH